MTEPEPDMSDVTPEMLNDLGRDLQKEWDSLTERHQPNPLLVWVSNEDTEDGYPLQVVRHPDVRTVVVDHMTLTLYDRFNDFVASYSPEGWVRSAREGASA